jgi:hypothetical protein
MAIIQAVRNWRHFLAGRHFTLKTNQRSNLHLCLIAGSAQR